MSNMFWLLAIILILSYGRAASFNTSSYDFLKSTNKDYCETDVFSKEEAKVNEISSKARLAAVNTWIPDYSAHMVSYIVLLCNNKREAIFDLIGTFVSYSLSYSMVFLLGLLLLLILAVRWAYSLFLKPTPKSMQIQIGREFTNQTQISLAVFIISLLVVVSVATYGMSKANDVQKGVNSFWCGFLNQDHGYLRGEGQGKGRMIDFAYEIHKFISFLTEHNSKVQALLSELQKKHIITSMYQLAFTNSSEIKGNEDFDQFLQAAGNVSSTLAKLPDDLRYFNDTMEYERQVMIGFTFIFGNLDRYGQKYIGFSNISKIISNSAYYFLLLLTVLSLTSIVVIGYTMAKERYDNIYYKYLFQYALGIICCICLIFAVLNSLFIVTCQLLDHTYHYLELGENPRQEFLSTGSLNDPLVQIMMSFWPQSPGNMTHYGKKALITDFAILEESISSLIQVPFEQMNKSKQLQKHQTEIKEYQEKLALISQEIKAMRKEMISPSGFGRLDPTAFGRFVYTFYYALLVHNFNNSYEYRFVFGYIALFLLMALISSAYIRFSYKIYTKANEIEPENNFVEVELRQRKGSHQYLQRSPGDD